MKSKYIIGVAAGITLAVLFKVITKKPKAPRQPTEKLEESPANQLFI